MISFFQRQIVRKEMKCFHLAGDGDVGEDGPAGRTQNTVVSPICVE